MCVLQIEYIKYTIELEHIS